MATLGGNILGGSQRISPKPRQVEKSIKKDIETLDKHARGILVSKDVHAVKRDTIIENWDKVVAGRNAIHAMTELVARPPKSAHRQLQLYRRYARDAIEYQMYYQELIGALSDEIDRLLNGVNDRNGKRWTDDEDTLLVEFASRDDMTVTQIALNIGRTPSAVQTRLSYLVGVQKVSAKVAGRFVGWLNGEQVEGDIDGEVIKTRGERTSLVV